MASKYQMVKTRLANIQKNAQRGTEMFVGSLVTVGACGGMSYVNARFGGDSGRLKFAGVDVDLAAGIASNVLAYTSLTSRSRGAHMSGVVFNALGDGLLCSLAAEKGTELGTEAARTAGLPVRRQAPQMRAAGHRPSMRSVFDGAAVAGAV